MTMSEWEAELRALRAELGTTTPMRVRWHRKSEVRRALNVGLLALDDPLESSIVLALFPPSAGAGDRSVVQVEVADDTAIEQISQGELADVAGRPEPGHAAVVVIRGHEYWPVYPCSLSVRPPRL